MSIKLVNIVKKFKNPDAPNQEIVAVKNVNLEVEEGEMVTFLGPSGCGKTTTLRIISGFESPTEGEVWIDDKKVNDLPPNKRDTSMVFQNYALFPHLSVYKNVSFALELKGIDQKTIREKVHSILELVGLSEMVNRRPDQLSGGQQQRVALARAIINEPKVLLFDEPLSNLDAKLREQMRSEIRRIQKTLNITSIYVTHDQIEAMSLSDRIMVMNKGEVMQIGTPFEIYTRPQNRFVADFIGRVNFIEGTVEELGPNSLKVNYGGVIKDIPSFTGTFSKGDKVLTVVRPESVKLRKHGKDNYGIFSGEIINSVYLGATLEYEIKVRGQTIIAITSNPLEHEIYKKGEVVDIDFPEKTAHIIH